MTEQGNGRWPRREVPSHLVERYEREGWWTDATLGESIATWLAAAPETTVDIHSRACLADGVDRIVWAEVARQDPVIELPAPAPDDVAVLAYTSGTTSDPKGVVHDHRTLLSELRHMDGWVTETPKLMGSPVAHATGMLGAVLGPFQRSTPIHLIDRWDPGHALEVMATHGIGGGTGASIFLATLIDHPDFLGYTNPALDAAFVADGWYRTGDIGVLDEGGNLTITDRAKDIIIRGGENLSAAEIEQAVATVPGVAEVAVVAAPDERLGEHACAVVRLTDGTDGLALADLTAHLEQAGLARQKWPEELRIVADLPRTPSGKVRKVDLRRQVGSETDQNAG